MILGIENRTENWKTALHFVPLLQNDTARLEFVRLLGEPKETRPDEVSLELYWSGVRDYLHQKEAGRETDHEWKTLYEDRFPLLHQADFGGLKGQGNYRPSGQRWVKLFDNLRNTEIDIVLQTPNHLFVGEAKSEMAFSASTNLFLVHQLVRQYVTASLLVEILKCEIEVTPFLIVNNVEEAKRRGQVQFMCKQGWLKKENILKWEDVRHLAS